MKNRRIILFITSIFIFYFFSCGDKIGDKRDWVNPNDKKSENWEICKEVPCSLKYKLSTGNINIMGGISISTKHSANTSGHVFEAETIKSEKYKLRIFMKK